MYLGMHWVVPQVLGLVIEGGPSDLSCTVTYVTLCEYICVHTKIHVPHVMLCMSIERELLM